MKILSNEEYQKLVADSVKFIEAEAEIDRLRKKPPVVVKEFVETPIGERVAELEVKMKKLWDLLVTTDKFGQDKLNKSGKKFATDFFKNPTVKQ